MVEAESGLPPEYEIEALMGRKIGTGGEPQYLVRWRGYTEADDSWEPWAQLLSCLIGMKAFHKGQFAAGTAPLGYAPGCPSREQAHGSDPDLAGWRISSKRTPSGREYRVYYGPLGEHVRARNIALTLAALYDLPADLPRVPTPPPTIGAPTANGHANAAAAIAQVDLAGAAASAAAIKASIAAAAANGAGANTAANTAANAAANTPPPARALPAVSAPSARRASPKQVAKWPLAVRVAGAGERRRRRRCADRRHPVALRHSSARLHVRGADRRRRASDPSPRGPWRAAGERRFVGRLRCRDAHCAGRAAHAWHPLADASRGGGGGRAHGGGGGHRAAREWGRRGRRSARRGEQRWWHHVRGRGVAIRQGHRRGRIRPRGCSLPVNVDRATGRWHLIMAWRNDCMGGAGVRRRR